MPLEPGLAERASRIAAALETVYVALPNGYTCDQHLATVNDSFTYGEMHTQDIAVLVQNVQKPHTLEFAELGSGLGKLAIAAASFFRLSHGVELAPERSAVAQRALSALGAGGASDVDPGRGAKDNSPRGSCSRLPGPLNVCLTTGDLREFPLHAIDVVFVHNLVFSSGLERALELKLDCELREGTCVSTQGATIVRHMI